MPKTKPLPSLKFLNEVLILDSSSPSGLRWKTNRGTYIKPGDIAGTYMNQNGWRVQLSFNGKKSRYKAHRLVYFMATTNDPGLFDVDHIDGNTSNNAIENLRIATRSQNSSNRSKSKLNTSGIKGVYKVNNSSKWKVQICFNYHTYYLGTFDTKEQAIKAYNNGSIRLHKEFGKLVE